MILNAFLLSETKVHEGNRASQDDEQTATRTHDGVFLCKGKNSIFAVEFATPLQNEMPDQSYDGVQTLRLLAMT